MTRQRIKDAAVNLFNQNGFGGASMRDIAQKAGIEAASIYNHFASKQDLLHCLCTETLKPLIQGIQENIATQKNATAQLEAYLKSFVHYEAENWAAMQATFTEGRHLEGSFDKSHKKQIKVLEDILADLLRKGASSKKLNNYDSEMACQAIMGALRWKHQPAAKGGKLMADQSQHIVRLIMDGLQKA
ncbi:MAG: TetR/AcrR family transcriptional regulator [Saprospiraceae bacterium]|nr:TetR/AcrR family transcriptional regulator [Saprospiraceae bacterium]